ncbi:GATA zinc finger domain-containing protein 1, partial [Stegodyphus mimosarum]
MEKAKMESGSDSLSDERKVVHSKRLNSKNVSKTPAKSRRIIFKKNRPIKSLRAISTPINSERLYYKGSYFTRGDVVSLVDASGRVYYAQVRGFLQDQFCEKSAVITWLLPTQGSPKDRFDPATYILGPEEDIPRNLDCIEFVCHAPSEYFKAKRSPYPELPSKPEIGVMWTKSGPKIIPLPLTELSDSD